MIRHWNNIKVYKKPEVVRFDEGRIQQWGVKISIWYTKNHGLELPIATSSDLKRLRRVIDRAIRILENESK